MQFLDQGSRKGEALQNYDRPTDEEEPEQISTLLSNHVRTLLHLDERCPKRGKACIFSE